MFPQVLAIVRAYVDTKVTFAAGVEPAEIALPYYQSLLQERVTSAIRPADEKGEPPLLPILDDMLAVGSTDVASFLTVRACVPTIRSHLSYAACDSGWEESVAYALDDLSGVAAWAKNYKLGLEIPYQHDGKAHRFTPDFVVRVVPAGVAADEGWTVVLEIKGLEREQDRSKDAGALRWIAAVNHWGRLGQWRYAKVYDIATLPKALGLEP
jgi:type III restriction enzyme